MMAMVSGKRKRKLRAPPESSGYLHAAPQGFNVALDHVEADTAPGEFGHLVGGGQAGMEDQHVDLIVRQVAADFDHAALDGLLEDFLPIESPAVVFKLDNHVTGRVIRVQMDRTRPILTPVHALRRRLDSMVHRVADHVH